MNTASRKTEERRLAEEDASRKGCKVLSTRSYDLPIIRRDTIHQVHLSVPTPGGGSKRIGERYIVLNSQTRDISHTAHSLLFESYQEAADFAKLPPEEKMSRQKSSCGCDKKDLVYCGGLIQGSWWDGSACITHNHLSDFCQIHY